MEGLHACRCSIEVKAKPDDNISTDGILCITASRRNGSFSRVIKRNIDYFSAFVEQLSSIQYSSSCCRCPSAVIQPTLSLCITLNLFNYILFYINCQSVVLHHRRLRKDLILHRSVRAMPCYRVAVQWDDYVDNNFMNPV